MFDVFCSDWIVATAGEIVADLVHLRRGGFLPPHPACPGVLGLPLCGPQFPTDAMVCRHSEWRLCGHHNAFFTVGEWTKVKQKCSKASSQSVNQSIDQSTPATVHLIPIAFIPTTSFFLTTYPSSLVVRLHVII